MACMLCAWRACTRARCCSRFHRLRIAWSVRDGSRAATAHQRGPSSRTAVTITSSSSADQLIRCRVPSPPSSSPDPSSPALLRIVLAATAPPLEALALPPAASWPPLVRRVLVGGGGGGRSTRGRPAAAASASSSSSRNLFQRLRTESSDRPGKCGAMRRQRMPIRWTQARMVASSSIDHAFRFTVTDFVLPRASEQACASACMSRLAAAAAAAA
eukprot:CAMPEP_0185457956 /NCGR_PEP_ID=MMETSP1365-20130426/81272_1 /TAXON_ID=38817 /ORGANISM="Gephyrocapsa oceanica, Strain RCC1303" /LENGTH=214 /DNA_ID=CAMNT_0028064451 /DNA_START=423 /DNA_END=1064 /DNA_ORIENTATION=+